MGEHLPARHGDGDGLRLSGDEAALVFARAAELDGDDLPSPAALDVAAVLEAADAAGISRAAVGRALAELRAGDLEPDERARSVTGWLGPRHATVRRVVPGTADWARDELHHWLRRQVLQLLRDRDDRSVWIPRTGVGAAMARGMDVQKRFVLEGVSEVTTSFVPEPAGEGERVLVCVDADLAGARQGWTTMAVGGAVGGVALVAGVAVVAGLDPATLAAVPAGAVLAGGGVAAARAGYRRRVREVRERLEGVLDRLERGGPVVTGPRRGRRRST